MYEDGQVCDTMLFLVFNTLLRKPAARLGGEVFFCEQSELRGFGPWGQSVPKVPEITELGGVELFKHF